MKFSFGLRAFQSHDVSILALEHVSGRGSDVLRRNPVVEIIQFVEGLRGAAQSNELRQRAGYGTRCVEGEGESVTDVRTGSVKFLKGNQLMAVPIQRGKNLLLHRDHVERLLAARENAKQFRIDVVFKLDAQLLHGLLFQHKALV